MHHPIPPVFNAQSRILILGSFPSVMSREVGFYYGHPQNRFWKILAHLLGTAVPTTVNSKREFLLSHNIALWDIIGSCEISGSADNSIRKAIPNDLSFVLTSAPIQAIFLNGKTAYRIYEKYRKANGYPQAIVLPSTSPANATYYLDALIEAWRPITAYL